ncbi:asparagine synthase-related protein [Rubellimicrobium roseum]|uniref:Asparagine synthetase domain-containing protein n=1 Tax=Rubellimicrobium roseum TaxID=687525 RepID=A0A5C4N316_9RHOB|nr:asparagine synthase-related protein [Rubellimicrobium roseum]TNC59052.1 hypothetical protein FHG71_23145 [Rubellimicrobium roseum]
MPYLPPIYDRSAQIWANGNLAIISWAKQGIPGEGAFTELGGSVLSVAGHLGQVDSAASMARELARSPKAPSLNRSYGGTAAFIWAQPDLRQLTGWTTMPSVVPLFHSGMNPDYHVIGARPMLVHFAARQMASASLREQYLSEMLASGYSLTGETVFEGVRRVALDDAIVIKPDSVSAAAHPVATPGEADRPLTELATDYGDLLVQAASREPVRPRLFRLSGGKDSRLVAAALSRLGPIEAVTDGVTGSGETVIAAEVARAGGFDHRIQFTNDEDRSLLASALYFNRLTEGLTSHDPKNHREVLTFNADRELVTGQGELHKGGYARVNAGNDDPFHHLGSRLFDRQLVSPEVLATAQSALRSWRERRMPLFTEPKSVLYWSYVDFRLGHWYMNRYMQWDGRHHLMMPLLDDRVSLFLATVPLKHKMREHLVYETVKSLNPSLAQIPLYEDRWACRSVMSKVRQEIADLIAAPANEKANKVPARKGPSPQHVAADFILSSSRRDHVREAVSTEMWDQLERFATKKGPGPFWAQMQAKRRDNFLFRIFMATTLYDLPWIRAYT